MDMIADAPRLKSYGYAVIFTRHDFRYFDMLLQAVAFFPQARQRGLLQLHENASKDVWLAGFSAISY